jgi:hypothetical protein
VALPSVRAVGSLEALRAVVDGGQLKDVRVVVVIGTAAVYSGVDRAMADVVDALAPLGAEVHTVALATRADAMNEETERVVRDSDLVILVDGAALHARSVWRHSPFADALRTRPVLALGQSASVLGEIMIDPRGGAPTTGLGLYTGVALTTSTHEEELERTRYLVGPDVTLVALGVHEVVTLA